ncbi:hypothetical protein IVB40_07635 [Bradyrhizobium sp. 40]|uniref:hypothetical protein n=1 Tax=Bradyrhizobium sp. 40 TaxID=2782674 RepID=UPI001FFE491F|nr:hypothetical protein [Bradyrhizobium sp. 40]UPJ43932.1 hypothetical protein IVB40_07635 [Bradyrhizobium sp. 40]
MTVRSSIDRVTFAGGEIGPQIAARADLAKYQIAVEAMENFIVMKGGGATRAPGTRFVLELKDQSQRGKLVPFRRTSNDYYALVINAGVSRFVRQGGFLQNPDTTPYEASVPWAEADLANLRAAQAGNQIFVASGTAKPQTITRVANLNWTCADYAPTSGPLDSQNLDTTITVQANGVTSTITLTGVNSPFTADMVGGVMRLDDRDLSTTPEWSAVETAIALLAERRWNGNVYQARIDAVDAGPNAPVHTEGDVSAGQGKQTWRFLHPGYGFVRITSFVSANQVLATVLTRLPANVVSGATYRWSAPAWTSSKGYPEVVAYNYPRLGWYRGNIGWLTGEDDVQNFDLAKADDTDAIAFRVIAPDGSLVEIKWALPSSGILMLGTSDIEWVLRGPSAFDALTPKTTRPFAMGSDGSAAQIANAIDGGVMFLGRTQKRLHYTKVDPASQSQQLASQELSVVAEHIFAPGVVGACWQRDPNRVLWLWFSDGSLASLTFMPEQQVAAFCRHPRTNAFIEDMCSIPSVSSGTDEVYLIVRRTIAGQTKRYVEQMADYFQPQDVRAPTAAGAWFLDCALRITGSGLTQITQLAHLEGQTVGVFADGAMQKRKVVVGGTIALDRPSDDILVGIPVRGYIRDLPRNFNTQTGSTTGEQKTVHEALVQLLYAGGGRLRVYNSEEDNPELWEPAIETGAYDYSTMPPLVSKKLKMTVEGAWAEEAQLEFECDDALPCTVLALSPKIEVAED